MSGILRQSPSHLSPRSKRFYIISLFVGIGFLFSAFQILGQSPDYENYEIFFDFLRGQGLSVIGDHRFEPGFTVSALALTALFSSNGLVYSSLVAANMLAKGWAISICSSTRFILVIASIFYLARFFPLHELTQLRAASAISCLLVSAMLLWRSRLLPGILASLAAILFHMSAAAMIPALFFSPTKRRQVLLIGLAVCVATLFTATLTTYFLAEHLAVFKAYQAHGFGDATPNPLSATLLLDWVMIGVALLMWDSMSALMKRILFLQIVGMAIFYGSLEYPVIAHRIRELYSVFWVFFIANGLHARNMRWPTIGFVVASIALYSYLYIFSGDFFDSH